MLDFTDHSSFETSHATLVTVEAPPRMSAGEVLAQRIEADAEPDEHEVVARARKRLVELARSGVPLPSFRGRYNAAGVCRLVGLRNRLSKGGRGYDLIKRWCPCFPISELATMIVDDELTAVEPMATKVRKHIEQRIQMREPLLRAARNSPYPSLHAIARDIEVEPIKLTRAGGPSRKIIRQAVKDHPWLLSDEVYVDPDKVPHGEFAERVDKVVAEAKLYLAEFFHLPQDDRRNVIDFELLATRAGVPTYGMRTSCKLRKEIQKLGRGFPILPHGYQTTTPGCYRDLIRHALNLLLKALGKDEDGAAQQIRNFRSRVNRWLAFKKSDFMSPFDDDFDSLEQDIEKSRPRTGETQDRDYRRDILHLAQSRLSLRPPSDLPEAFDRRLDDVITVRCIVVTELAERVGAPRELIASWRAGMRTPARHEMETVRKLEIELEMPPRSLTGCVSVLAANERRRRPAKYNDVNPRIWSYMDADAPFDWSEERVRAEAKRIEEEVLRQPRSASYVMNSELNQVRNLAEVSDDLPIFREWKAFTNWKRKRIARFPRRRPNSRWCEETYNLKTGMFTMYVRWAATPTEHGGAGLDPRKLSMAQWLNPTLPRAFVRWRAHRCADVAFRNDIRGIRYTAWERSFLMLCAQVTNTKFGWLAQQPDIFSKRLVPAEWELPWPDEPEELLSFEDDDDWADDWTEEGAEELVPQSVPADRQAMSKERIKLVRDNWEIGCRLAESELRDAHADLGLRLQKGRDPFEPIMPILKHDQPLAALLQMLKMAYDDLPRRGRCRHIAVRDLAIAMFLTISAFRSKNLRNLTYNASGMGHLRRSGDSFEIMIPYQEFKNFKNLDLFGDPDNRSDYHRVLPAWPLAKKVLDLWLNESRAEMLKMNTPEGQRVRSSDLLFPSPTERPWDADSMGRVIRAWTRKYCIRTSGRPFGLSGVMAFSAHAFRDIVATHIVRTSNDPERFRRAADLLQTSETMIRRKYAWVSTAERFGKSDHVFDEAFAIVASGVDLLRLAA